MTSGAGDDDRQKVHGLETVKCPFKGPLFSVAHSGGSSPRVAELVNGGAISGFKGRPFKHPLCNVRYIPRCYCSYCFLCIGRLLKVKYSVHVGAVTAKPIWTYVYLGSSHSDRESQPRLRQ